MRIVEVLALTVILVASFRSPASAEMTVMSLQERMRQSDAVVVGTVAELRKTSEDQSPGIEHWLAACHVDRYIKVKIHNPHIEEGKKVSIIHVVFTQMTAQKPAPVKLAEGKKYLLFLKETGPNGYEMITPYHGAFEAGQEYFAYDEHDPQYPQAVKLSFEEIIRRLTPQDTVAVDIRQQLDSAISYWYAYFNDRAIGEGKILRNVYAEGEWTVFERFGHHGWNLARVMTRFLDAEETKMEGIQVTLNGIEAALRSTIPSEVEEGIREIEILTGMDLKNNVCSSPEKCLRWLENNERFELRQSHERGKFYSGL